VASASPADDLVTEGQALARQGRIGDALAKFREADQLEPRAVHSCLLGLAYLRGGALGNAEISFATCHRRAGTETLPPWVAKEEADLAQKLTSSELGTISLTVSPSITELAVPALLDGAWFPVTTTLHIPAGSHRIAARQSDGSEVSTVVEVKARENSTTELPPAPTPPKTEPSSPARVEVSPPARPSPLPKIVLAVGGASVVAGVLVHALAVRPAYNDLDRAMTGDEYDQKLPAYELRRNVTVALYGVGAVALITGALLYARQPSDGPRISAQVGASGGSVVLSLPLR
jgi:hypothetical protein